jgi:hypothetical protein
LEKRKKLIPKQPNRTLTESYIKIGCKKWSWALMGYVSERVPIFRLLKPLEGGRVNTLCRVRSRYKKQKQKKTLVWNPKH